MDIVVRKLVLVNSGVIVFIDIGIKFVGEKELMTKRADKIERMLEKCNVIELREVDRVINELWLRKIRLERKNRQ